MRARRREFGIGAFALFAVVLVLTSAASWAGTIDGRLFKPMYSEYTDGHEAVWKGYAGMPVSGTREGELPTAGFGNCETSAGEPVGAFYLNSIAPGNYNLMFHEKDEWGRFFMFNQTVPNVIPFILYIRHNIKYQDVVPTFTWDVYPAGTWSQSFVAKGKWVTQVGIHQTTEFGPDVRISIHEGGPDGPQIGPAKMVGTHVANPSSAYWSAGEVPTVPGQTYTVNFYVQNGFQVFLAGSKLQGGNAYPDGRTYKDFQPSSMGPIKCTIYQDTDGIITCVNTRKKLANVQSNPLAYVSVTTVGQTFTAKGTSLLGFTCFVGNTAHSGNQMEVTVFKSPGVNGQGANKVGVAKYLKSVDYNTRSGCVWKPDEVPLVEGESYYIRLKCIDGQPFTIYYVNEDEYAGGMFYKDGYAQTGADLSTTICTEEEPGSATRQQVGISNINVTRGTTTATIAWNTDVPTTTNYVDYGQDTPYTDQAGAPSGGQSHSVTLSGLTPNTQYHYRVVSKTAGRFDRYSRDFVFVTDPDQPNLIANPSFETGSLGPWVQYAIDPGDFGLRNYPYTPSGQPGWFGDFQAHTGGWAWGGARNGTKVRGGVYQRVAVTQGDEMNLRAWLWSYQVDNVGGMFTTSSVVRVGIDPTGGTDPASSDIVWGPWITAQDTYGAITEGDGKGDWTEGYVRATATSDYVTCYLQGGSHADMWWTVFGFDDAVLTKSIAEPVDRIADIANKPNGALVRVSEKSVVGTTMEVGANYVEEPDRTSGIRVESGAIFYRGDTVTVQGRKGVKPSGEPYLYDAGLVSATGGDILSTMTTQARSIGLKNLGPSNVGMLMQVCGKVTSDDGVNYYINDGSLPAPGIKFRTDSLSWIPFTDETYSISGIVQLEGTFPNAKPILWPRDDMDIVLFLP